MAPKTKEQNKQIREQTKAKIIQVALELFAHKGYGSTSISLIAKQAGISKGLLYNYFDGKEDLLVQIMLTMYENGHKLLEEFLASLSDPKDKLRAIINGSFQNVYSNVEYWKLGASLSFQEDAMAALQDILSEMITANIKIGKKLFTDLGYENAHVESLKFGALMDGVFFHYIRYPFDDYPLEAMKHSILKQYNLL